MINRLLSWYWRLGGVVIATSNRLPQDLYNSGVQRNSVNTFLDALEARCPPVELRSATDYRREQRGVDLDNSTDREAGDYGTPEAWKRWGSESKGWFVRGQEKEFKNAVYRIIGDVEGTPAKLKVYPPLCVHATMTDSVYRSTAEICRSPGRTRELRNSRSRLFARELSDRQITSRSDRRITPSFLPTFPCSC